MRRREEARTGSRALRRWLSGAGISTAAALVAAVVWGAAPGAAVAADPPKTMPVGATQPVEKFTLFNAEAEDELADDTPVDPKPAALTLVAPRNGSSSDVVVARDAKPIAALRATVGDFKAEGGGAATIPAKAFEVRYAAREGGKNRYRPFNNNRGAGGHVFYDDLVATAPTADLTVPIWLTARVPADAAPGKYAGTLTVVGPDGRSSEVPVSLTVSPWQVPDPKAWTAHVGILQSPESVALKYKVPYWTDRHFQLIDGVFQLLGQVGNKALTVSAITDTQLGNYESLIRFVKSGDKTDVDFSLLDRYLESYAKHNVPPDVFYVYAWDNRFDKDRGGKYNQFRVTLCEQPGGMGQVSRVGMTYDAPEAKEYFTKVMAGLHERVERLGWKPQTLMYGLSSDAQPSQTTVDMFKSISPATRWASNAHPYVKSVQGVEVGYATWCRGDPPAYKLPGWTNPVLEVQFERDKHDRECGPNTWRYIVERSLSNGHRGHGRIGADFWHVILPGGNGPETEMDNRPGASRWTGNLKLNCSTCAILAPGPDGPVATARFEMLRESLQDTEARVAIERVLLDPKLKAAIGDDLARRAQDELSGRRRFFEKVEKAGDVDWKGNSARLFALADEVQRKAGAAPATAAR